MNNIKEKLKKTFIDLIKISEVYPHENEVIRYVEKKLEKEGIKTKKDKFSNIVVKIEGKGDPVMLNTHLDIPEPNPNLNYIEEGDIIRSDGNSILGCDPKSGLAVLLEFLVDISKINTNSHVPIEVVFTRGEESGLLGAMNFDYSLLKSKIGLVLDEDGPVTQVVTKAPAFVKFKAEIIGKSVHPREPEKGVNALQIMCEALTSVSWGYSKEGVTWNIGKFEGGTAMNTIPGKARLLGELRSYNTEMAVNEGERIKEIFKEKAKKLGGDCKVKKTLEFEGYSLKKDHELFKRLQKTYEKMSLKPNYFETFGGADANIFNAKGIVSVPVGSGYYNAHQYTEYIKLSDMEELFLFLNNFVSVC